MHALRLREQAVRLLAEGTPISLVSRRLSINRSTITHWRNRPRRSPPPAGCPRCEAASLDDEAYAALLGFYLGDGYLALGSRYDALRITCDLTYPAIIDDVKTLLWRVRPNSKVFLVRKQGCVDVQSQWKHWRCLFPQAGPGHKHERPIVLEPWQRQIVELHPAAFLRGLFHSDGARSKNWTRRKVGGDWKRYDYPRWQFSNNSEDIRALCTWALDLLGVAWRPSSWKTISVSRRPDVRRLDELIGLKR